nr:aminodeoxychorismate/anthranilate synthase component II [uncultured Sphingomonas sp.]
MLLLDNVDSFTFMLADYLKSAGADVRVERADAITVQHALDLGSGGIVISPGPGAPENAGISVAVATEAMARGIPLLGVCLGHQAMAVALGQAVIRTKPVHGKVARLRHDGTGLFCGMPEHFAVTRYHSLAVPAPAPPLVANAWSDDGTVMAFSHENGRAHGAQFHPESVATEYGHSIIRAFVELARRA